MKKNREKILFLSQFSLLLAIEALFCFTPLGSLPAIAGIVTTLAMIPVIITAILLGPKAGTLMGFFAGLFSFIIWTFMPPATSVAFAFVFTPFYTLGEFQGNFGSILICFIPRILVGTFSGLSYKAFRNKFKLPDPVSCSISAVIGSMTNTILVLLGIWIFFSDQYSTAANASIYYIIGFTTATNGVFEAIASAISSALICTPLNKFTAKRKI